MKKTLLSVLLSFVLVTAFAQINVQLHYDLGNAFYGHTLEDRPHLTSTVECFKADRWGSTYFFVDFDYKSHESKSAYWEISRELKFWKAPIAAHVEYNGGLNTSAGYNDAYIIGPAYNWCSKDFTKTFSLQLLYRYVTGVSQRHNWQTTIVWGNTFAKGLCTFSGFADLWHDNEVKGNLIFLSEPQFWFNLNKVRGFAKDFNLSVGSEVEISNNFVWNTKGQNNRFYALPTLAAKWTF